VLTVSRVPDRILGFLLAAAALVPDLILGQQPSKRDEPSSFLVQLAYLKTEVPASRSSTCIAVFPDGHFHLEKSWRLTITGSGSEMFEGTLSDERLRSLTTILAMDDLKKLKVNELPPEISPSFETYSETEIIRAVIPRQGGPQNLSLVGLGFLPEQHPRPLPASVNPLVQWIRTTTKQVERQKGSRVQRGDPVDCWLSKMR
jgi:hypothetical protein